MSATTRKGELLACFTSALQGAIAGTGAEFWDGHSAMAFGDDAFFDAVHVFWPQAQRFTAALVEATGIGNDVVPHSSATGISRLADLGGP